MIRSLTPWLVLALTVSLALGQERLSPEQLAVAGNYRPLFLSVGEEGLTELHSHEDDSIAIQSAWESVTLSVPGEDGPTPYAPDASKVQWFLGFVEGRARVEIPEWWREVVIGCRANRRDNIYPGDPQTIPYDRRCPVDAVIEREGEDVVYRSGDDEMRIPEDYLRNPSLWNISGSFTEDRFYFTVHADWGKPHRVGCIDRQTGELVWESEACGSWWGFVSGGCTSYVSIIPTADDRVFVFGHGIGFYMHAFNATNGETLMKFSSNY